jgi:hypothetical protein
VKTLLLTSAISFYTLGLFGQSGPIAMGARAAGLGYSSATLRDEWSLFNNVAGLSKIRSTSVAFAYEARPSAPGSNRAAVAMTVPVLSGSLGLGMFSFGDPLYNERSISAGFSNQLGIASLGLKLAYVQYYAQGYGIRQAWSLNFGGIAQLTPHLLVGAYILNLNEPTLSQSDGERIPPKLTMGLGFKPSDEMLLNIEVEKDLAYAPLIKGGGEYVIHKKVAVRSGFNLHPNAAFFGIGFAGSRLKIDYAIQYSFILSAAYHASATYRLGGKRGKDEK